MNDMSGHDIRQVLAKADHPVAILFIQGERVEIGYDESDTEPSIYVGMPDRTTPKRLHMTTCEAALLVSAITAAQCLANAKLERE